MLPNHSSSLKRSDKDGSVKRSVRGADDNIDQKGLYHATAVGASLIKTLSKYIVLLI